MARPRQTSDEEILLVAKACFIEHGPGVSTLVIAERLGVSQPTLFKRFGSKKELMLAALLPPAVPDWIHELRKGPDERSLREQLSEIGRRVTQFFMEMTPAMMVITSSGLNREEIMSRFEVPPPILGMMELGAWIERAQKRGLIRDLNPQEAALSLLGPLHIRCFFSQIARRDPQPFDAWGSQQVELFARGLEPRT